MDIFTALAEPTRRTILERLAESGIMSATDIYRGFSATPPAISQHLKVLREANLVKVQKQAQKRIYYINPEPMKQLEKWVKRFSAIKGSEYRKLDKDRDGSKAQEDAAEPLLPFGD